MAHKEDINGWWKYENTPLTKEGVFPYRGKQIDSDGKLGLDPNKLYPVYRPAKEITSPEFLDSLNGIWLTDEHQMLGEGAKNTDQKRCDGTIYNVRVSPSDPTTVICTMKVMSPELQKKIQGGKRQLSCGYYCDYKPESGTFKGQHYDFVQVDLYGNHVALVNKGRMGGSVAVMDSADIADLSNVMRSYFAEHGRKESQVRGKGKVLVACDSAIDINQKEVKYMPNEKTPEELLKSALEGLKVNSPEDIEKIVGFINQLAIDKSKGGEAPADGDPAPAKDGDPAAPAPAPAPAPTAPTQTPDPAPAGDPAPAAADPAPKALDPDSEEFKAAVADAADKLIAKRAAGRQLATDLESKCGSDLYKEGMDEDDVAAAACEKLGHADLPKESKLPFAKAIAAESKKEAPAPKAPVTKPNGMDSADKVGRSSVMAKYLQK